MSNKKRENELVAAVREGLGALRSGRTLRTHHLVIMDPPVYTATQISRIRMKKLHASQRIFAGFIGVSASTVKAWEQGQRKPSVSARRLLQVAEKRPEVLRDLATNKMR